MYKGLARETRRASTVHRKRLSQWSLFSRIIQRFLNHIYVYHGLAQVLISTSTVRSRPRVLRFCAQDWFDPDDALSPTWRAWCQKEMLKVWRTRHSVFVAKRKVPVNFGGVLIFVDGERSPEDSLQEAACRNQKKRVLGPWTSFGHLCAKDHIFSFFLFTLFHKSQKERCDDTLWEWNAPNHTFLKRAWSQSASFLNSFHVFATCFLVLFFWTRPRLHSLHLHWFFSADSPPKLSSFDRHWALIVTAWSADCCFGHLTGDGHKLKC